MKPFLMIVFVIVLGLPAASVPIRADEIRKEVLEAELKRQWDGLGSFAFHCETCLLDEDNKPDRSQGANQLDFAWTADGRRMMKIQAKSSVAPDTLIDWTTQDARRKYHILPFNLHPNIIDRLVILPKSGGVDEYRDTMAPPLWFFFANGKPLHKSISGAAKVEPSDRSNLGSKSVLVQLLGDKELKFFLDPDRDWLPSVVEIDGHRRFRATRIKRVNGRYFPTEIVQEGFALGDTTRDITYVTDLKMNVPFNEDVFHPPSLPDGAYIDDKINNKYTIRGGRAARDKLVASVAASHVARVSSEPPITASSEPPNRQWAIMMGGLSTVVLIVAVVLIRSRSMP